MRILVTGAAGFIGYHVSRRLLLDGHEVCGYDGMTPYYDVRLKQARWAELQRFPHFCGKIAMLEDRLAFEAFAKPMPDVIIHLAAQAGVRYSLENPRAYMDANLLGTYSVLEVARGVSHLLIASTSSVYGANRAMPFRERDRADHPLTLYAATKKATEDMAHAYAHLWGTPTTAFRFFTVYGPWGRPDMALFKFVAAGLQGLPIEIYGGGQMSRDFTYIDDIVEAIMRLMSRPPVAGDPVGEEDSLSPVAPYRVVNIGAGRPTGLLAFIESIERAMARPLSKIVLPMQKGELTNTWACSDLLHNLIGPMSFTPLDEGIKAFVDWYLDYCAEDAISTQPLP